MCNEFMCVVFDLGSRFFFKCCVLGVFCVGFCVVGCFVKQIRECYISCVIL